MAVSTTPPLLIYANESSYGTAVEHHVKYQYQFANTHSIFMGYIQTETAYYQPNPPASIPFPENPALNDPVFPSNTSSGWGLRIFSSNNIYAYGAGFYSFFHNYDLSCSGYNAGATCQQRIASIEGGRDTYDVGIVNLNTVGSVQMVTRDGVDLVGSGENNSTFVDTVCVFRIPEFGL